MESEPSKEYESMRRRAYRDVQELWFFARSKLDLLKKESKAVASKVGPGTGDRYSCFFYSKVEEILTEMETREQVGRWWTGE